MTDLRRVLALARQAAHDATHALAAKGEHDAARRKTQSALDIRLASAPRSTLDALACRKGCAMCCHLRVAAMPVEVFGVVRYLRQQFDADGLAAAMQRIRDTAATVHAQPRDRLLAVNIACPMLGEDGACTVYPARPLNCRAYHSLDVSACRESFDHPDDMSLQHPQSALLAAIHSGTQDGLRDSLRAARADTTQYELVTALAEAFDDPDCERRHAGNERAFRRAIPL